jgi:hypothetical protein
MEKPTSAAEVQSNLGVKKANQVLDNIFFAEN